MDDVNGAFGLNLQSFLAGEEWEGDIDVDRIFSATGLAEIMADADQVEGAYDVRPDAPRTPSTAVPGCVFVEVEAGVVLLSPDGAVAGCYLSTALAIDGAWQGMGLGAEIVLERILRCGENPVWNLDSPQYSPGGLAAHRSAWWSARSDPAALRARMARIEAAERPDA